MKDASAPCLFYLFGGDLLLRIGRWPHAMGDVAVPVPAGGKLVSLRQLEAQVLAVALWDMAPMTSSGSVASPPEM